MATTYSAIPTASLKTAYLQREVVMDVTPAANMDLIVGQVVSISAAGALSKLEATGESTEAAAIAAAKALVVAGTYIIAQSDQTMGYGHVPVEDRDYRYSNKVDCESGVLKKIAVFKIVDVEDVIVKCLTASQVTE